MLKRVVRSHPGPRAGRQRRGGLRALVAPAGRRRDADPAAEPRGCRGDPAAPPGEGGAADAPVPAHRRRGPAGGVPGPAHRAQQRLAGYVHAARELRARGADQDVHAAAARRRERVRRLRRADGGGERRSGRPPGPGRVGPASGCARSSVSPAASRATSSRPRRSSSHGRAVWNGPRATRRTPTGTKRPASTCRGRSVTAPTCTPARAGPDMGALIGLIGGLGLLLIWRQRPARPAPQLDVAELVRAAPRHAAPGRRRRRRPGSAARPRSCSPA